MDGREGSDSHLVKIGGDCINIYESSDVLMAGKVPQQGDFSQSPFRKLYFLEDAGDQLDCNGFSGYLVGRRAIEWTISMHESKQRALRTSRHHKPQSPSP